jgi:hypothetical protein
MESGFDTVKDILDVVIVPVVIFALGAMLPHIIELGKRRRFLALIRREMMEMKPRPLDKEKEGRWHLHLKKKFIHEQIFEKPSENRDFILSLPPDLAYGPLRVRSLHLTLPCSSLNQHITASVVEGVPAAAALKRLL